jgi:hypothetical protein
MLASFIRFAAALLGPWSPTAAGIAVGTFLTFLLLHAWVRSRPLAIPKRAAEGEPEPPVRTAARRTAARMKNGFVSVVDWLSIVLERISITAAVVAVVGFAAVALSAPSTADAVAPLLGQAQGALKAAAPAAYSQVEDLSAPTVKSVNGTTTFTFKGKPKKGAEAPEYVVKVNPNGTVEVAGTK